MNRRFLGYLKAEISLPVLMNLIYYWMAVDRIIDGGIAFQMLVGEGGFCWVSNSSIDIELHKPTPTDP